MNTQHFAEWLRKAMILNNINQRAASAVLSHEEYRYGR